MVIKRNDYLDTTKSRGQSLVEFALVLPLLLMLVLGAMDFGRLFYTKMVITNAAREGANYFAYHPGDITGMKSVMVDEANSSTITLTEGDIPDPQILYDEDSREIVKVTVEMPVDLVFDSVFEFLGMIDGPIQLESSVEMMVLK